MSVARPVLVVDHSTPAHSLRTHACWYAALPHCGECATALPLLPCPPYLHSCEALCEALDLGHVLVVVEVLQQLTDGLKQVRAALVLVTPVSHLIGCSMQGHIAADMPCRAEAMSMLVCTAAMMHGAQGTVRLLRNNGPGDATWNLQFAVCVSATIKQHLLQVVDCSSQHGQAPQASDGVCQVALGIVQLQQAHPDTHTRTSQPPVAWHNCI